MLLSKEPFVKKKPFKKLKTAKTDYTGQISIKNIWSFN